MTLWTSTELFKHGFKNVMIFGTWSGQQTQIDLDIINETENKKKMYKSLLKFIKWIINN